MDRTRTADAKRTAAKFADCFGGSRMPQYSSIVYLYVAVAGQGALAILVHGPAAQQWTGPSGRFRGVATVNLTTTFFSLHSSPALFPHPSAQQAMEGPSVVITPVSVSTTTLSPQRHSGGRGRSNSLIKVEEVGKGTQEEVLDQSVYANINAEWVNRKGAFPFDT